MASSPEPARAPRRLRIQYRDNTYLIAAEYWGHPIWGWLPAITHQEPTNSDADERSPRERMLLQTNEGFRTPHECLAAAVHSLIEALDRGEAEDAVERV